MRDLARRLATVAASCALSLGVALPALAAPPPAGGPMQAVSLELTPRDRPALVRLVHPPAPLTRAARRAGLAAAIAGPDRAARVAAISRGLGLQVTGHTDYAVGVRGPASLVRALFGSARSSDPAAPTAQPLPGLPPAYAGLVTVAAGGDDTRPAVRPHAVTAAALGAAAGAGPGGTLSVAQTRSLYGVTATTAPPAANAPIVATLQFSTWSTGASDLRTYASRNALYPSSYDPTTGVSTAVVSGSCALAGGGETEVALDQETLLSVAPQLRQRIYLAPNCGDAQDTALQQAAADANAGMPILALGTSWGVCEPASYADTAQATADRDAVDAAEAAGITIFAASGDSGAHDCTDSSGQPIAADAVDSPGVIPGVVSVGGTTLTSGGGLTAWDDATGASGGGFSCGFFALPAYQSAVAQTPAFPGGAAGCAASGTNTGSRRQVPDLAADGGDGLAVVNGGALESVHGTSFAAQLASAGYAQTLGNAGRTVGLGDIGALLYQGGGWQDVQTGGNGAYQAAPGFDEVTGLGTPNWSTLLGGRSAAASNTAGLFTPVTPFRTTGTAGPLTLGPGQTETVPIAATGPVPAGATGVVVNLTVASATATTYLTAYPAGGARPQVSSLNAGPGQVVANLAQLALGSNGALTLYNNLGTTAVDLDVVGYFGGASTDGYTPLAPTRLLDTRTDATPLTQTPRVVPVAGQAGVPTGATAVVLNLTAVDATTASYLTAYPDGAPRPFASSLNIAPGQTVPNLVTVGLGPDGAVDLYNNRGTTDVVADVVGYYSPGGTLQFTGITPGRLLDTRNGVGRPAGQVPAGTSIDVATGYFGIPADAQAVVGHVTGTGASGSTYVTAFPGGTSAPLASTLNLGAGQTVANLDLVGVGSGGDIALYNNGGQLDLIADVTGYYSPTYGDTTTWSSPPTY